MNKYNKGNKDLNYLYIIISIITFVFMLINIGTDCEIFTLITSTKVFIYAITLYGLIKLDIYMKINILKNEREERKMKSIKFFSNSNFFFSSVLLISLFMLLFQNTVESVTTLFICLLITSIGLLLVNIYFTTDRALKMHSSILNDEKEEK
ncbi:hypothetical protein CN498_21730 [Bacillus thuringiensis]|uniref:Uncharacterized protein n=2 Tax=Bacillaceae TaxID=186817 RepID=B7IZP3_BACC2|nr:hypothetical protein BCG9842_A0050 [Bacillus cereus G9842]PEC95200.1 hypothetical protein CON17_20090 [Bacillus thuringiensis]PER85406.1 hypothetical protein CN498_21730 [Bacillus thuringiensis]